MIFSRFLILAAALVMPSVAKAQGDDRTAIVLETVQYMRTRLGTNMVLDGEMRAHFMRHGKSTEILDKITERLNLRVLSSVDQRRCHDGFSYYVGAEKFVSFNEPEIAGDSALVTVNYTYTPDGNPRTLVSVFHRTIVRLNRVDGRWAVIGEIKQEDLHLNLSYCGDAF
jgi:hypothetical protein